MCGIAGIYFLTDKNSFVAAGKNKINEALKHRGPDYQSNYSFKNCTLFHARLTILDLSSDSNQPFLDSKQQKGLVYNGEIFNYKDLQPEISDLKTSGDVEVLFKLFEKESINCLNKLNGFFAFAFFDSIKEELHIARDRYGVKPLYYFIDKEKIAFASELKALLELIGPQELNHNALHTYLRLNYISGKETIFKNVFRLMPGEFISVKNKEIKIERWYKIPVEKKNNSIKELLTDAVKLRLHADVPVGCFLSGGLDSSIISALAKQQHDNIHTFSIGFADEPFFDETEYAELVAKHINSTHHTFKLKNTDLLENITPFLQSIDEPFADSSAFNVYVLSKYTKQHVKVALSGDGADELFMGYNKHKAELLSRKFSSKALSPLVNQVVNVLPDSRNKKFSNKIRQLKRFSKSVNLDPDERYINWACISSEKEVNNLMLAKSDHSFNHLFDEAFQQKDFNPVNYADLKIVLADDMLVKADRMSMQHGLEIRNPFLDYRIVEFAMNLPENKKISNQGQKLILKESFRDLLPTRIFTREKKGFELPLWKWLKHELKSDIEKKWLNEKIIKEQNIFNYEGVQKLKQKLYSDNPGDSPAQIWALIVFQNWYANFKNFIKTDQ
ncbi:MAG TPA: asparagine synthase (glutamine-hydrolyzing) [Bacteroidia bacterium]|jgi:asparagine synthase (glutamine-hydrolysing)|nr:asparagine synthase (glutamine-hydrolyzing) [Bacteroidia bacterium]